MWYLAPVRNVHALPVLAVWGASLAYAMALAVFKWLPRYDCLVGLALLLGSFRLLEPQSHPTRTVAVLGMSALLLTSFLVHLWSLGYEGRNAVFGGVLPWSDSIGFYSDAMRLVHGARFTAASSRRPLFVAVLAGLLNLGDGNLRLALAVIALVSAVAISAPALEVWRTHGFRAALMVYAPLLWFERRWTGFVQTEHFGLPVGALGFVLFWRASALADSDPRRAKRLATGGLFALALALLARAGAFFVLPALLLWMTRTLASTPRERVRITAGGVLALALAFGFNKVVLASVGRGVAFSDYPAIVYGLIHGEDYTKLTEDHPALRELPVERRVAESWRVVRSEALGHPLWVVRGFARSGAELFASPNGIFSYLFTNPDDYILEDKAKVSAAMREGGPLGIVRYWVRELGAHSLVNFVAMALLSGAFVLGVLVACVRIFQRHFDHAPLLRYAAAGILLSAPFLPPWITSGMQVQTATLPFVGALVGVTLLGRKGTAPLPSTDRGLAGAFAALGTAVALILWVRLFPVQVPACGPDRPTAFRPFEDTYVVVREARARNPFAFREKAERDLETSLRFLRKHNKAFASSLSHDLHPGTGYVAAYEACAATVKVLADPDRRLDGAGARWLAVGAEPLSDTDVLRVVSAEALAGR